MTSWEDNLSQYKYERELSQRVATLEEENEELKEKNKELKETILSRDEELGDITENVFPGYDDDIKKLKEENDELKAENNKIKKEVEAYENTEYHDIQTITKLKEENEKLKEEFNDFVSIFDGNVSMKKMTEENKELKELVDYDGHKIDILETEVNNAMDYIDEAIERYSSPNPLVHKSTMLADFAELKKLLMN